MQQTHLLIFSNKPLSKTKQQQILKNLYVFSMAFSDIMPTILFIQTWQKVSMYIMLFSEYYILVWALLGGNSTFNTRLNGSSSNWENF